MQNGDFVMPTEEAEAPNFVHELSPLPSYLQCVMPCPE